MQHVAHRASDEPRERVRLVLAAEDAVWCRLPDAVVDRLGWREGDRVEVAAEGDRIVIRRTSAAPPNHST